MKTFQFSDILPQHTIHCAHTLINLHDTIVIQHLEMLVTRYSIIINVFHTCIFQMFHELSPIPTELSPIPTIACLCYCLHTFNSLYKHYITGCQADIISICFTGSNITHLYKKHYKSYNLYLSR